MPENREKQRKSRGKTSLRKVIRKMNTLCATGQYELFNPFMSTVAFNICCPRDCFSRHNGGTSGAPLYNITYNNLCRLIETFHKHNITYNHGHGFIGK